LDASLKFDDTPKSGNLSMRLAVSSLILAVGFATVVNAQEQSAAPAAAPPPPAEAPAPEAAPPAPSLPTTGNGAEAIAVLEKICKPSVRGEKLDVLAKANGYKLNRREGTWTRQLGAEKGYSVILFPPGSNKGVCLTEFRYPMGQDVEVSKALNVWAFVHQPPLDPTANYTQAQDPDGLKRVRRSWEHLTATGSIGLNFSTVRKPDDTPLSPKYDTATMQYQERTF
jgi:hypothetical protein